VQVEYDGRSFKGEPQKQSQTIAQFLYDEILFQENYHCDQEKIRLEDQPRQVVEAMGRLVERLIEKNILDLNDLKYIAGSKWGRKSDSLALKKEDET